jgi:hypothetical protein
MVEVITIARFGNVIEASLAKQSLEAEDITVFLTDEGIVNVAWLLTVVVGGIRLQVPEPEVTRAMSILATTRILHPFAPHGSAELIPDDTLSSDHEADVPVIPDSEEDDDPVRVSWADRTVDRMFRAAVLGIGFLPLHLYSLWLLIRLLVSFRRVNRSKLWKIVATVILISPIAILALLALWTIFQ